MWNINIKTTRGGHMKIFILTTVSLLIAGLAYANEQCGTVFFNPTQGAPTFSLQGFYLIEKTKNLPDKLFYFDKQAPNYSEQQLKKSIGKKTCVEITKMSPSPVHSTYVEYLQEYKIIK